MQQHYSSAALALHGLDPMQFKASNTLITLLALWFSGHPSAGENLANSSSMFLPYMRPIYQLTLHATPNHPWKPEQRIKRLLKIAGRTLGLRCVSAKEVGTSTRPSGKADAS